MKFIPFLFLLILISCQPQVESRAHMDNTSNRTSDSLSKLIDSSLALPSLALIGTGSPIASATSTFTPK
ncbi:MAG TPA: hypothetical protein VN026_01375 [Bacteroidia bacterium]|jgi:hypothetical protein|nr:hypothetical protein [Bacteroidia bacterium]